MIIDGDSFYGVANLEQKAVYEIEIESKGKLDLLTITNCHRQIEIENAYVKKSIFGKNHNKYFFRYAPTEIEQEAACMVEIAGYEEKKGRHSFGLLSFKNPTEKLTARISCNGFYRQTEGSTLCQSKSGLKQLLRFNERMLVYPESNCDVLETEDEKNYYYETQKGYCIFLFASEESGEFFRLTTFGYEEVILGDL